MVYPLYRGCPLLRGSNRIILIGRDKFGDLVLSIVERYLIQCPFLGGSSLRGSTVNSSDKEVGVSVPSGKHSVAAKMVDLEAIVKLLLESEEC